MSNKARLIYSNNPLLLVMNINTYYMKSGKVLLMIFILLVSAIGFATLQEFGNEHNLANMDDLSSKEKMIEIKLSDGVESKLSGSK